MTQPTPTRPPRRPHLSLASLLLAASVLACSPASAADAPAEDAPADDATSPQPSERGAQPQPRQTQSGPPVDLQPSATPQVVGEVVEVLEAGSYTYFRLESDDQTRWIVTMDDSPDLGARVRASIMGEREDFHSARLDRDFAVLSFAQIDDQAEGGPT